MTGPKILVADFFHGNDPIDMRALKNAGVVGVVIKAGQGRTPDPTYGTHYNRAVSVWPSGCVHSYWFLDGEDRHVQMAAYVATTQGHGHGRWLDWEQNPSSQAPLAVAAACAQILQAWQSSWPGMYGSDGDLLGKALDQGHFDQCPHWIAGYSHEPKHVWDLWQFAEGVEGDPVISGMKLDLSTFKTGDSEACIKFLESMSAGTWKR